MKQCIDIPRGWQRVIKSQNVVYVTPSSDELKSKDDILQYLTSPGTCKCGLQCPLHLDSLFSFDAAIKSKDSLEKPSRQVEPPGEKVGKSHSANETVKGPPISHSCNLKTVKPKKAEGNKSTQNVSSSSSKKNPTSNQTDLIKDSPKSMGSPQTKKPAVEGNHGSTSASKLPPISIFCQVNRYAVQQILQLLYSSLEKRTQKLRSPLKQLQNPDVINVSKDVPKPSPVGDTHPKNINQSNHGHRADIKPNVGSINVKNKYDPSHLKSSQQNNNSRNLISNTSAPKAHKDPPVSPQLPLAPELMNTNQSSKQIPDTNLRKAPEKPSGKDKNIDAEQSRQKIKQQRNPGNMLQIVQSEPNRGYGSQNNMWPPPYAHTNPMHPVMNRYPSNYYAMNQQAINQQAFHQRAMNHQAMLRMPGCNPLYGQQPMVRSYNELPSQDDKRTKSKTKSKSKQPPKISKQPAIVIQPDKGKVRIDGSSKPTLLVSLGDYGEKKVLSKSSKASSDHNLTSVDSILKTCTNPNLGTIPDIDDDVNSEHYPVPKPVSSEQSNNNAKYPPSVASSSQFSNSMIPVQYLTPSTLMYGVPLIQNEPRQNRDHKSSKSVEKWEGVLSPSEVDAKVQQILSSPQKNEEPSQAAEKESSPKKRKRQQSAPHMYDRYPGNPALRFQTGHSVKASKLSKSEPHTPSNIVMSSAGNVPIVQNIPVSSMAHPHWAQFQPPGPGQIPSFPMIHPMTGQIPQIADLASQVEGRKSH